MCAVYDGPVFAKKSTTSDAVRTQLSSQPSPKKAELKSLLGAVGEHARYFFSLGLEAIPKYLINIAFQGVGDGGQRFAHPRVGIFSQTLVF